MLVKLYEHRHKGHWEDINIDRALDRMSDEVVELSEAIMISDHDEIHREAADVANFALIVSSVLRRKQRQDQLELFINE